jgi:hypothetical protein
VFIASLCATRSSYFNLQRPFMENFPHGKNRSYFFLFFFLYCLLEIEKNETNFRTLASRGITTHSIPLMSKEDILWRANAENVADFTASQCTVYGPEEGTVLKLEKEYTFIISASPSSSKDTRLAAGAHFEVLLHSQQFRSRPRIEDMNNGNYTLTIYVPGFSWLEGTFTLEVYLLCSGGGGVSNDKFVGPSIVDIRPLNFVSSYMTQPPDEPCGEDIWKQPIWSGYWIIQPAVTISGANGYERQFKETIIPLLDNPKIFPSNPKRWIYRLKNCFFPVQTTTRSQKCINSSWIFMQGDSNVQDTTRNLALNALQLNENSAGTSLLHSASMSLRSVDRTSDIIIRNETMYYRSSIIFNGAFPPNENFHGLLVYDDLDFLKSLKNAWIKPIPTKYGLSFFKPSLSYVNDAGLHGAHNTWGSLGLISYLALLHDVALPALELLHRLSSGVTSNITMSQRPKDTAWLWRNTITPSGKFRTIPANPYKVEIMNHLIAHELKEHSRKDEKNIQWSFIDAFDLTYPWHYDNSISDGAHYGRYGNSMVDDMLVQILLHFYCSDRDS